QGSDEPLRRAVHGLAAEQHHTQIRAPVLSRLHEAAGAARPRMPVDGSPRNHRPGAGPGPVGLLGRWLGWGDIHADEAARAPRRMGWAFARPACADRRRASRRAEAARPAVAVVSRYGLQTLHAGERSRLLQPAGS